MGAGAADPRLSNSMELGKTLTSLDTKVCVFSYFLALPFFPFLCLRSDCFRHPIEGIQGKVNNY